MPASPPIRMRLPRPPRAAVRRSCRRASSRSRPTRGGGSVGEDDVTSMRDLAGHDARSGRQERPFGSRPQFTPHSAEWLLCHSNGRGLITLFYFRWVSTEGSARTLPDGSSTELPKERTNRGRGCHLLGRSEAEEAGGLDTHQGQRPCPPTIPLEARRRPRHSGRRLRRKRDDIGGVDHGFERGGF
jgi:hypothetical protein